MKTLEWSAIDYLGNEMYEQWQSCLMDEKIRNDEKEERKEHRQHRKEEKFLKLQHKLQMMEGMNTKHQQSPYGPVEVDKSTSEKRSSLQDGISSGVTTPPKKKAGIKILNRIGLRKSTNNLVSLVSPERIRHSGGDEISESINNEQENLVVKRSTSSPNL